MNGTRRYELTITVRDGGKEGIEAVNDRGATRWGSLDEDSLRLPTIAIFEDWLRRDKITRREELEVLGQHLYRLIFNGTGDIENFFKQELHEAVAAGKRLRLQLTFIGNKKNLISLPWEFLYYMADRSEFLATHVDLVLSRYMPVSRGREDTLNPDDAPLRVLIAVSKPDDLGTVSSKEVVETIRNLSRADEGGGKPRIQVETLEQPTVDSLYETLRRFDPHVLHFIGHGRYNRLEERGEIALVAPQEQSRNSADWRSDKDLVQCFSEARSYPRLIFLHMCEGGEAATSDASLDPFTGFAPNLVRAEIPAVVAMRYPIRNSDAKRFAEEFYRELSEGGSVDAAVQAGRGRLGRLTAYRSRVFGTPLLYIHSYDGLIMPPPPQQQQTSTYGAVPAQRRNGTHTPGPTGDTVHSGDNFSPGGPGIGPPAIAISPGQAATPGIAESDETRYQAIVEALQRLPADKQRAFLYTCWNQEVNPVIKDRLLQLMV